jgi:hypothetical protein
MNSRQKQAWIGDSRLRERARAPNPASFELLLPLSAGLDVMEERAAHRQHAIVGETDPLRDPAHRHCVVREGEDDREHDA